MNILFVDANDAYLGRRATEFKAAPLIGLTSVASYVASHGHNVRVFDAMVGHKSGVTLAQVLAEFRPDVVGLTATTPFLPTTYETACRVRHLLTEAVIVLGGPHATALPHATLNECPEVDYLIVGEGERSLVALLGALGTGGSGAGVPGVLRQGESPSDLLMRPLIRDLDELPYPDWSLYQYSLYDRVFSRRLGSYEHLFQIMLSRGCPWRCSFCFDVFGWTYRMRSPQSVVEEVDHAVRRHGARLFEFVDPTMTADPRRFTRLCGLLRRSDWIEEIAWSFETRADRISPQLLAEAKSAGCESVLFGVESGSQVILDAMNKRTTPRQNMEAIAAAVRAGLEVRVTLVVGHPGETPATLAETLAFVRHAAQFEGVEFLPAFLGVYPGTDTYRAVEAGEAGCRWVPGVRGNWSRARRDRPMIEPGGLSTDDLMEFMDQVGAVIDQLPSATRRRA